jgi:glycosyltransferase involved in cell wall biosynthesis
MKLAVVDHIGNVGGGSRVVRALLPAIKTERRSIEITYFGNPASIDRENIQEDFYQAGIKVVPLNSLILANRSLLNSRLLAKSIMYAQAYFKNHMQYLHYLLTGEVHKEIESRVKGFDLAFFPWPFLLRVPKLECPLVGIFHDFNFKYYFSGVHTFNKQQSEQLNREIPQWLEKSTPVVSTNFMAGELAKFYPEFAHKTRVAHLSPMSMMTPLCKNEAQENIKSLGIYSPYILYPTQMCSHKNIGPLISALAILRQNGHKIQIVLTGLGTERINGRACEIGVELVNADMDVIGLGYVSNLHMDSLIQCAAVVVSSSLYEAGNGPGIDAWARGVPVAMSNIPAFIEHLEVQNVRAEIFDPHSPQDIADKIHAILTNPYKAAEDARHSQQAIQQHTWKHTATNYLKIFDQTLEGKKI